MQTSVLQWGNWGSEMSLSRLAQGHTTSRSQAGSSSRPRLCAARLPLPAAPQMESSSLGDGATGTAVHRQLGRALRYSGGLTLSIACPPPASPPFLTEKAPRGSPRSAEDYKKRGSPRTTEEMYFVRHREEQQGHWQLRAGVCRLGKMA